MSKRKNNLLYPLLLLLFLVKLTFAQVYQTQTGKVAFVSDAPLEIIKANSNQLKGAMDIDKRTFAFQLPMNSLKGFNSSLQQEHFYENYVETEKYPTASFKGKIIENIYPQSKDWQAVRAKGIFQLHGVEQERIIRGKIRMKDGLMELTSGFIVLLEDHNITIPKLVYQKIAEEINIEIEAVLSINQNESP